MKKGYKKQRKLKKNNSKEQNIVFFHGSFLFPSYGTSFFHRSFVITQSIYPLTGGAQKAYAYLISNLSYLNSVIKATIAEICYLMSCSQAGSLTSTDPSARVS